MNDRKRPAHMPALERHNTPVIVFVTVCSKERKPVLANQRVHEALLKAWEKASQWRVGRYIVMPDHIHLFCAPALREAENVSQWVGYWKRSVSTGLPDLKHLWQRDCWDTQLRREEKYEEKWAYVRENAVRKGLVENHGDWSYQGIMNELRW